MGNILKGKVEHMYSEVPDSTYQNPSIIKQLGNIPKDSHKNIV